MKKLLKKMIQMSIGIISYNEEKNIINLLNSIKFQFLGNFFLKEIIISDDSNDNTHLLIDDFIKKNPQLNIRLFHHDERRGASAGWNEIFKEVTSEYLVLYDADIILTEKTTYNLITAFNQEVGLCASNPQPVAYQSIYGRAARFISNWLANIRKYGLSQFTVMGRALAIRSSLAKQIIIPEDIIAIDYFLQLKVMGLNKQVKYVDHAIIYFKTPENLNDFLSQVLRANYGHKQLASYRTIKLPIISNLKITLKSFISDPAGGLATVYCYCFIPCYKIRNRQQITSKWEIAESTKI